MKKGAEIVVCTPGRMIDILCLSNGKITNLKRCTFIVLDEVIDLILISYICIFINNIIIFILKNINNNYRFITIVLIIILYKFNNDNRLIVCSTWVLNLK